MRARTRIDRQAKRVLTLSLAVRKLVDLDGPHGWPENVHLYLVESLAFRVLEGAAAVHLQPSNEKPR